MMVQDLTFSCQNIVAHFLIFETCALSKATQWTEAGRNNVRN